MELSPLLIFWLLLASAVAVAAVLYFRPQFGWMTATSATDAAPALSASVGLMALVWLVWFLLGRQLPLTSSPSTSPLTFSWQLDELGWRLSGVWLLLVTAVQVASGQVASGKWQVGRLADLQTRQLAYFLLAAAGLLPLLAGNLAAALLGVTLLIGVWSAALWLGEPAIREDVTRLLPHAAWLMLSLLFIWLAAAFSPDLTSLAMAGWPRLATSSVLVAALLLLGYWPFHGWRASGWQLPAGLAALLVAAPALAGLSLLARLVTGSDVGLGYSLFLTLFGLLGVFMGVRRAWGAESPVALAAAVALVQANLAGLALVWVGPEVAVGEARVLALVVGLVFMGHRWFGSLSTGSRTAHHKLTWMNTDFRLVGQIGLWLALAGLSGLPLLAGFGGRTGLYAAWLGDGRFILVLVVALLQTLLVTAVATSGKWQVASRQVADGQVVSEALTPDVRRLLFACLLLAAGLVSFRGLAGTSIGVWLALLLPFGGGLALAYFVREAEELRQIIRRAFVVDLPLDTWKQRAGAFGRWLQTAVQDAATIWEGEGGLLWLLALLIVLAIGN